MAELRESELLQIAMAELAKHQDMLMFWRCNTGAFKDDRGHFIRFGHIGAPDIEGIIKPHGRYFGFEIKTLTGKHQDSQKMFEKRCNDKGGMYYLCRTELQIKKSIQDLLSKRNIVKVN